MEWLAAQWRIPMSAMRSASRRDFLKQCLAGAAVLRAGGSMGLPAPVQQTSGTAKSEVVIAHDDLLHSAGSTVDSRRVLGLLDRAMQSLFDRDQPIEAWKRLVHPGERVTLKVNALGGRGLSSNLQLVEAICERLQQAGIKANVYGDVVWGSRTLQGNDQAGSQWKYVPVRRLALFIESSLYDGTQWVVFEPKDRKRVE